MNLLDDLSQINFVPKPPSEDAVSEQKPNKKDKGDGRFVASQDEEAFGSDFYDTREEAIRCYPQDMGLDEDDLFFVAETTKFTPTVDCDRLVEMACEDASEAVGEVSESWLDGLKNSDMERLRELMNEAFHRWLREVGQMPRFYACEKVTDHRAPPPPPPPQLDMFEKRKTVPGRLDLNPKGFMGFGPNGRFEV